jgi:glutathione synthase/RimK-type ligase-like ATP-grasp enzyme
MPRIAFTTYHEYPTATADDLLTLEHLQSHDIEVIPVVWDDQDINWQQFDAVVNRSTWDYVARAQEFRAWIDHLEQQQIHILNPAPLLRWNMDKTYLRDLQQVGIRITPTVWLAAGTPADLATILHTQHWQQAVVKPTISAGGENTWWVEATSAAASQARFAALLQERSVLVQEFMPEIKEGEWSLLFFNGEFSHALLKVPAENEIRVQEHLGGKNAAVLPRRELIEQAAAVVVAAEQLTQCHSLYARVDGVLRAGELVLMELEMVEPSLFLHMDSRAPSRFAAALAQRLQP